MGTGAQGVALPLFSESCVCSNVAGLRGSRVKDAEGYVQITADGLSHITKAKL